MIQYPTLWLQWPSPWPLSSSQISPWPRESFGYFSLGKYPMQIQSYEHQQQSQFLLNTPLCYPPPCSQLHVQLYLNLNPYHHLYPNPSACSHPYPNCNHNPNPNPNHQVAQQFEPPILFVDSHIEQDVTPSILGKGMNLETSPIIAKHLPEEHIIQRPPKDQYFIGTCSENVVETQSPRIHLNLSCESKNRIFEPELEGFNFCLSPDFLCLQENDYQTMEDFHQLENHKYVDFIES